MIVLLGSSRAGKSSIVRKFTGGNFTNNYVPTIGLHRSDKYMEIDSHIVNFQMWDYGDHARKRGLADTLSLVRGYYRDADAVLFVFNITSDASFLRVKDLFEKVRETNRENPVLGLVGTKLDLSEQRSVQN